MASPGYFSHILLARRAFSDITANRHEKKCPCDRLRDVPQWPRFSRNYKV